jgi:hypothetical protein
VIFVVSSYFCLFVSYLQYNLRSKASTSQIKPHIYFILDIAGRFRISCNLLTDYMSNISTPTQKEQYISRFSCLFRLYLTILRLPCNHNHCTLLQYITLCYFSFCHISNFLYVKELHPHTQETRQTCGGQTCPLSCVMLNLSINYLDTKVRIIFNIRKKFT